jgi:phosphohistidine phosphatase
MRVELLLMRHGPAGDARDWARLGRADAERPLTAAGRRKSAAAAAGLARAAGRIAVVATSPRRRAAQTAALAAKACGAGKPVLCEALAPGRSPADVLEWLKGRREPRVLLVGHEPGLSRLASWLMTGDPRALVSMKKAQAVLLDLPRTAAGAATLVWSLAPRHLRKLAV